MATTKKQQHYFVMGRQGGSVHLRGAFESREAAETWVKNHYPHPCWLVPAEYIGSPQAEPLNAEGKPTRDE